jgi:hypothetical protein
MHDVKHLFWENIDEENLKCTPTSTQLTHASTENEEN